MSTNQASLALTECGLTLFEREILDFESGPALKMTSAEKDRAITVLFEGISKHCYYVLLHRLLDSADAEAYAPETVHRLRAIVEDAVATRLAG